MCGSSAHRLRQRSQSHQLCYVYLCSLPVQLYKVRMHQSVLWLCLYIDVINSSCANTAVHSANYKMLQKLLLIHLWKHIFSILIQIPLLDILQLNNDC